tara:strand:+ start:1716 stop:3461 length:1746 start_codon:yes stop_codon:yes gene_type:complete
MCGIFCVIKRRGKINIDKCKKTLSKLNHRGPDWSFNKIFDDRIFMGQTVLSMTGVENKNINNNFSSSKNSFLLYNGEIYNYKEINHQHLKTKLSGNFSDTKVFVNLIEEKRNKNFINILDGMYASIFYDIKKKFVTANRDPQGEKILYYYIDNNEIIFSSEVNSIVYYLNNYAIDYDVLSSYFLTRHLTLIDRSLFKKINILRPGFEINYDLLKNKINIKEKTSLDSLISKKEYERLNKLSSDELVENLDFLLNKNIQQMLPRKRLFGSIFSGGVDSSLVSKYVSHNSDPLEYLFINHQNKDFHTKYMKEFSKLLGSNIKIVDVNLKKYYKFYKKSLKINGSPINSHSWVGQLIISDRIRKLRGKAVFGGEGADELFGGYETYRQKISNILVNNSNYTKVLNTNSIKKNEYTIFFTNFLRSQWKKANKLYSFLPKNEKYRASMMLMDLTSQMSSNGLRGADLMGMANSVEMRSIFFRKEILRFGLNLPIKHKISLNNSDHLKTKILLKKVFLKYFPKKLLLEKQGFAGFPNETKVYLPKKKISFKNMFNKKAFSIKKAYDRNFEWKVINTKFFLNRFENKL